MPDSRSKVALIILAMVSVITLTGFGCRARDTSSGIGSGVNLVVWGLWHESAQIGPVIETFKQKTGATVEYKKIASVSEYQQQLLEALAQDRGPDIFVIHHTWVEGKQNLLVPAPASIIDERALREEFVDVVASDLIRGGALYALPASVDTLALYYNTDITSAAGIASPPKTWDQFQQMIEQLTRVTRLGVIQQSGAALGTAQNVNRAADIIQLLFLQSGISPDDATSFTGSEGVRVLTFYTDFANKSKKVYTWDLQQDYSIDAFTKGNAATMVNYSYHAPTVRAKNPRLRFAVAAMPQIAGGKVVNFASYWPYAVSKKSKNQEVAWQFIRHLTNKESSETLNQAQAAPPARRDSIATFARHPFLGIFAEQTLTAATWPRPDIAAIDTVFNTMIDGVITGAAIPVDAVRSAADQLQQIKAKVAPQLPPQQPIPGGGGLNSGFF